MSTKKVKVSKRFVSLALILCMMVIALGTSVYAVPMAGENLFGPDMSKWTAGTYTYTELATLSGDKMTGTAASSYEVNADGSLTTYKPILEEDATAVTANAYNYMSIGDEIAYKDFERSIEFNIDIKSDKVQEKQANGSFADVSEEQGGSRYLAFWYTDDDGKKQMVKIMGMNDLGVFNKRADYPDGYTPGASDFTVADNYYSLKIVLSKEESGFKKDEQDYTYGWKADIYDKNNSGRLVRTVRYFSKAQGTDTAWKVLPSVGGIMLETYLSKEKAKDYVSKMTVKNISFVKEAKAADLNWNIASWLKGDYTYTELAEVSGNGMTGTAASSYEVNTDGSLTTYKPVLAADATAVTANAYNYMSIGKSISYEDFAGSVEFNIDIKSDKVQEKQANGSFADVSAEQGGSRYLAFWYTDDDGKKQMVKIMGMNDLGVLRQRADYPDGYTPGASDFTVADNYYSLKIVLSKEESGFKKDEQDYTYGWKADIYDKNNSGRLVRTVRYLGEAQGTDSAWKVLPAINGIMTETYIGSSKAKTHESRITVKNTSFKINKAESGSVLFDADYTDTSVWGNVGTTYTSAQLVDKKMTPSAGNKQKFEITAQGLKFTPSVGDDFESTQTMTLNFDSVATGAVAAELELLVKDLGDGETNVNRELKFNTASDPIALARIMANTSGLTPSGANFKQVKGFPTESTIPFTQVGETDKYIKIKVVAYRAAVTDRWSYITYDMNDNERPMTISMSHFLDKDRVEKGNISSIGINVWRSSSNKSATQSTTLKSAKVYKLNDSAAAFADMVINENTKTELTLTGRTATFTGTVYARGKDKTAGSIIIAGYDANGFLVDVNRTEVNGISLYTSADPLTYTFNKDVAKVKLMIWNGTTPMIADILEASGNAEP